MYGGVVISGLDVGDCWLLNIEEAISQSNPEKMWIRCKHHEYENRSLHAAAVEPSSGRLWIVGGVTNIYSMMASTHIRQLTFSSNQTLKVLALESVVRNEEKYQESIRELPQDLQIAITAMKEDKYIVT